MVGKLNQEFKFEKGDQVAVLVNGMGATPLMEQYIFMNDVLNKLADLGLEVKFTKVGSLMTSLEMAGISLTLFKVSDEIVENLNYATDTIAW